MVLRAVYSSSSPTQLHYRHCPNAPYRTTHGCSPSTAACTRVTWTNVTNHTATCNSTTTCGRNGDCIVGDISTLPQVSHCTYTSVVLTYLPPTTTHPTPHTSPYHTLPTTMRFLPGAPATPATSIPSIPATPGTAPLYCIELPERTYALLPYLRTTIPLFFHRTYYLLVSHPPASTSWRALDCLGQARRGTYRLHSAPHYLLPPPRIQSRWWAITTHALPVCSFCAVVVESWGGAARLCAAFQPPARWRLLH